MTGSSRVQQEALRLRFRSVRVDGRGQRANGTHKPAAASLLSNAAPPESQRPGYFGGSTIVGVTKIRSSVSLDELMLERNRRPSPGIAPR